MATSTDGGRPAFEAICLACEVSACAPDEGEPRF